MFWLKRLVLSQLAPFAVAQAQLVQTLPDVTPSVVLAPAPAATSNSPAAVVLASAL